MYQVIIVGAGPAGAYLAYLLSRDGIKTLLLEKEIFPRYKPCAGGITSRAAKLLPFGLETVIEDNICKIVYTHNLTRPVTINFNRPVVYTVSREYFDSLLVEKAKEAGAEILEGIKVVEVEAADDIVIVHSGVKKWKGEIIVGADGALSIIARKFGLALKKKKAVSLEVEIPLPADRLKQNKGLIKIDYGLAPLGYAWIFPKANHLSLGVGSKLSRIKKLRYYLEKLMRAEGVDDYPKQIHGWTIPMNPRPDDLQKGRALVLGDAAGLVDSFTGEGIYNALFGAQLAAMVIKEQIGRPRPNLQKYSSLVRDKMDLQAAFRISRWFYPTSRVIHRVLNRRPEFARYFTQLATGNLNYSEFFRACWQHLL